MMNSILVTPVVSGSVWFEAFIFTCFYIFLVAIALLLSFLLDYCIYYFTGYTVGFIVPAGEEEEEEMPTSRSRYNELPQEQVNEEDQYIRII